MSDNLKQKTLNALTWTTFDRFGQQAVQFVIGLILARLLTPYDYTLLGMVMIFASVSYVLVESGFSQALIRKIDANETDYNTIFYFNIFVSVLLYTILFFLTPPIALYFNQPKLILLGRVIFIAILFNALYLVPYSQMAKKMDFKSIAKVNLTAAIMSGSLGVVLAFLKYGVWALVIQQVSFHFVRSVAYYYFIRWKPKLLFSFDVIREFWSFSMHILGSLLLNALFNNLYVFILGKFHQNKVGYYTFANKLNETFLFGFLQILLGSTYSMFSQIQNDDVRFRRIFREISKKTSVISIPIMLVLIAVAHPFIFVLLTEKWLPSVPYFQLIGLASLFLPFYSLNISALNARGLSKITFNIEIIKKVMILFSVFVCFKFGVITMLWGYSLACFLAYLISVIYIKMDFQHYIKNQIKDLMSALVIGIVISSIAYALSFFIQNQHLLLITQLLIIVLLYIFLIKRYQSEFYYQIMAFIVQKKMLLKK